MKTLKILLAFFIVSSLFLGTLDYFKTKTIKSNNQMLDNQTIAISSKDSIIHKQKANYWALFSSKQKTDTVIVDISGQQVKEYEKRIKNAHTIVYLDTTNKDTKQLIDSITSDDLTLNYVAEYIGTIFSIDFSWNVKQKTITVENIVLDSVPYPVRYEVPINMRKLYISGEVLFIDKTYLFVGFDYFDKKGWKYGISIDPFNKIYMGKAGFKLFSF